MINIKINKEYKSIKPCEFELPEFCVLTGLNGSGKTHLLEAIADKNYSKVFINEVKISNIKYIRFNALNSKIKETCDPTTINSSIKGLWQTYKKGLDQLKVSNAAIVLNNFFAYSVANSDQNFRNCVAKLLEITGKNFLDITEEDISNNYDAAWTGEGDFFTAQFALIFKNYHRLLEENNINIYYKDKGIVTTNNIVLSESEFVLKNGVPPWEFVDKILREINVPYKVSSPVGTRIDSNFDFNLIDKVSNKIVKSDDLSTGEKVLMSLALAIYNSKGDANKPELLLIDEPDAALHPSMSKKMVQVLNENIVQESKIPALITSHSPTTIISSEGISIYQMVRGNSIPEKISVQNAVEMLSSDIPFLKISNDKRRQVFVESKYDVQYYELLTNILSQQEKLSSEPIYIPARTSNGSNCTDVIDIVKNLSTNGNDQIYGIIDWDESNKNEDRIIVLGTNERYSIENYLLDPLLMGLLFIRETKTKIEDYGNLSISKYSDIHLMTVDDAQVIIDKVLSDLELLTTNKVNYSSYNGWTLQVSEEFNKYQGHSLEALYKVKYPFLKNHQREDSLKKDVIEKVINDYPQFTPIQIFETIKMIS
jgi:ABC-type uncharacterized transport system ATPase component